MTPQGTPRKKPSSALLNLGLRYAREDGITLKPGDTVPMGWLTANHETGRSDVDVTAPKSVEIKLTTGS